MSLVGKSAAAIPCESILPAVSRPHVLQEPEHDVRGATTRTIPRLPSRHIYWVIAQQLAERALRLPAHGRRSSMRSSFNLILLQMSMLKAISRYADFRCLCVKSNLLVLIEE